MRRDRVRSKAPDLAGFLQRGKEHYGEGRVREALDAWRSGLALAPQNQEARELVTLAERQLSAKPTSLAPASGEPQASQANSTLQSPLSQLLAAGIRPASDSAKPIKRTGATPLELAVRNIMPEVRVLVSECREHLQQGRIDRGCDAAERGLRALEQNGRTTDDLQSADRALFERAFSRRVGNLAATPRVVGSPVAMTAADIDATAGFILSFVDGKTPIVVILDACGMPRFSALRALAQLMRKSIVR